MRRKVRITITARYDEKSSTPTLDLRGVKGNLDLMANTMRKFSRGLLLESALLSDGTLEIQMTASVFNKGQVHSLLAKYSDRLDYDFQMWTMSDYPDKAYLKLENEYVSINQLNAHVMNATHDESATIKFL